MIAYVNEADQNMTVFAEAKARGWFYESNAL